jgi:hypothetical protein
MTSRPHDKNTVSVHQNWADCASEESPNNRAGCQVKECKDSGSKIMKGQFRYATQVTIKDHVSWQYRHWYVLMFAVFLSLAY